MRIRENQPSPRRRSFIFLLEGWRVECPRWRYTRRWVTLGETEGRGSTGS